MDNSGRSSWKPDNNYVPLRKPRGREDSCPSMSALAHHQLVAGMGALSVDAPAFIPTKGPGYQPVSTSTHYHGPTVSQNNGQYYQHPPPAQPVQLSQFQQQHFANHQIGYHHNQVSRGGKPHHSVQNRLNMNQQHHAQHRQQEFSLNNGYAAGASHHRSNYQHHQPHSQSPRNTTASQQINKLHYQQQQQRQQEISNPEQTDEAFIALNFIEQTVKCLIENPGVYDSIENRLVGLFEGLVNNNFVMSNAIEIIFNQSIEEQNFRYMGAKLYRLLDSLDPERTSVFRSLLILKLDYHKTEILSWMRENQQHTVRGTTLFLAELYMQLRNDGNRIKDIANNIVYTMEQLLQRITPENVKCVCLTLKLAGYELEMDCPVEINKIIQQLQSVNSMDVSTTRILETVLSLCKNNWGRSNDTRDNLTSPSSDLPTVLTDGPVFYGPDGQIMTEEENLFLEENISNYAHNGEDHDSGDCDDGGMNAEMDAAYQDFLNEQNKK